GKENQSHPGTKQPRVVMIARASWHARRLILPRRASDPARPPVTGSWRADLTPVARLTRCPAGHPDRPELEALIRSAFQRQHQAQIEGFMPSLVGLSGAEGHYVAAAGVRGGEEGSLF